MENSQEESEVTGTFTLADNYIEIGGKAYNVAPELLGLFNVDNKQVLTNAEVTVTIQNNVIKEIKKLTLNEAGLLNAEGAAITELIVNTDQVSVENLIINGDVTLTENVTDTFNVKNVKMENFITQERAETVANIREVAAVSTRLKITFTDSTVAYVEIRQDNVHFAVGGSTLVETLSVRAEGVLLESPTAILPNLKIDKGVTKVELNASIANVVIETENPVEISGKGNFESVVVNTKEEVKIATEGTIGKLQSNAQNSNIELGRLVKVGETVANGEKVDPGTIIKNIDEVKDNINVDVKEEDKDSYFVVKPMPVKEKFGLVTLSLTNANNATIKYEYVEKDQELLKEGQSVPANTKIYTEGQEINWWFLKDLHVYKVDANNKVVESFRLSKSQFQIPLTETTMTDDIVTIKSVFSEDLALEFLYIADEASFWMTEEKAKLSKDENGIPTVTVKVGNNFKFKEGKTYAVHFNVESFDVKSSLLARDTIGIYNGYEAVNLNILKRYKEELQPVDKNEGFTAWDYYHRLENLIREIKQDYTEGPGFQESYYKFVLDEILNELTVFDSVEEVKTVITNVEKSLASDIQKYNDATTALNNLYRDDRHDYNYEDQLRPDVTIEEINAVKVKIEALPEQADKERVMLDLNSVMYQFRQGQLTALSTTIDKEMQTILENFANGLTETMYTENEINRALWELSQSEAVTALNNAHDITISIWYRDNQVLYNFKKGEDLWSRNANFPLNNITVTTSHPEDITTSRQALSVEFLPITTHIGASYGEMFNEAKDSLEYWVSENGEPFSSTIEW
ncbi:MULTISPECIES: hypothetical protein [Solibacillus]|uniref:hypothetical protein n=1 Tax=Solibacillus TaxID=648800 RepID=UPI0003166ECB|nr:hypothetical protein [Solibacillus silvestris]